MSRFQVIPAAYLLLTRGEGDTLEVLLQLRGPGTGYLPGHWASGAAGHVEYGESVFVAAAREAAEELGISYAGMTGRLDALEAAGWSSAAPTPTTGVASGSR